MSKQTEILNFIYELRNSHSTFKHVFTNGSCLNFYLILRKVFPEAIPYFNVDHIIVKIDNNFYDITGKINKYTVKKEGYIPYSDYGVSYVKKSFKQMYKYENNI